MAVQLSNNVTFVESPSELLQLPEQIENLYLDLETSSNDPSLDSLNPWKPERCSVCLAALTWDDHPVVYVLPAALIDYAILALKRSKRHVNHNVKYDAHVLFNNYDFSYGGEYADTLTLAKLVDSDRMCNGGYGLDALSKTYVGLDLSSYDASLRPYLATKGKGKNKDYGAIPIQVLADYAGNQVQANRKLYGKLCALLPEECTGVWKSEKRLTQTLIASERRGLLIDVQGVNVAYLQSMHRMLQIEETLKKRLGYPCNPKSHKDCKELLINRFGLPPIYRQHKDREGGEIVRSQGPSFDKEVLEDYSRRPGLPSEVIEVLEVINDYRHRATMCGLFWGPWRDLHVDGVLHSDHNQCVSSGRMSCSQPNSQQFDDHARSLIKPRPGYSFVVHDYSQIEFRLIVHYINNQDAINAYAANPDIDFHQYVADSIGIDRDPAKTINLAMGYGMGKEKLFAQLRLNESIVTATGGDPIRIREVTERAYGEYHRRLPELMPNTKMAERAANERGYVKNAYGRRCLLPPKFAYRAFNRVCQSHGADLIKERANALDEIRGEYGAHILAIVHDEILSEVPTEKAERYASVATEVLNQSSISLRVPIRSKCGISTESWLKAKG